MNLTNIFKKAPVDISDRSKGTESARKPEVPEGLLKKCNKCGKPILVEEYQNNLFICPKCQGYLRMHGYSRIFNITDKGTFSEWDTGLQNTNPLKMVGYPDKVERLKEKTGLDEAVITGQARVGGIDTVLMVMDGRFMSASMGYVVGEKITRAIEKATELRLPIVLFACSGGARMQEGMTSLMQMAKTSAALKHHSEQGLLYISVLTDPTTGGVTASFAMLGDIILAEPGALIGFAGPRVIEQTIGQKLPKGFQKSEFLLEHGFIDHIVERKDMRKTLVYLLKIHANSLKKDINSETGEAENGAEKINIEAIKRTEVKIPWDRKDRLTPWQRVTLSRKKERPVGDDYIAALMDDFFELHGDRYYGDDPAICGGIAEFHKIPVTVIAQVKGRDTRENVKRNFGMPEPEGYRKALRLMKQAEKFHRPVICFVDTPGAYPGIEAEERGQAEAIAANLFAMSDLKTPVLSILIGEGGSGGALALAVADEVWILENATYSILSPEGFASILWKDAKRADKAAKAMKLTSYDLCQAGFVEEIIEEPEEYTLESLLEICEKLDGKIQRFFDRMSRRSEEEMLEARYQRFRKM